MSVSSPPPPLGLLSLLLLLLSSFLAEILLPLLGVFFVDEVGGPSPAVVFSVGQFQRGGRPKLMKMGSERKIRSGQDCWPVDVSNISSIRGARAKHIKIS
jgi:hypothetical protein